MLVDRPDLGALPAARRLWDAGQREAVYEALESSRATAALKTQLLLLAAADPDPRLVEAARKIIEANSGSPELAAAAKGVVDSLASRVPRAP